MSRAGGLVLPDSLGHFAEKADFTTEKKLYETLNPKRSEFRDIILRSEKVNVVSRSSSQKSQVKKVW